MALSCLVKRGLRPQVRVQVMRPTVELLLGLGLGFAACPLHSSNSFRHLQLACLFFIRYCDGFARILTYYRLHPRHFSPCLFLSLSSRLHTDCPADTHSIIIPPPPSFSHALLLLTLTFLVQLFTGRCPHLPHLSHHHPLAQAATTFGFIPPIKSFNCRCYLLDHSIFRPADVVTCHLPRSVQHTVHRASECYFTRDSWPRAGALSVLTVIPVTVQKPYRNCGVGNCRSAGR
jgi:hypothetical protein